MKRIGLIAAALALGAPAQAQSRNPLDALRLDDLAATRERPLFRATRRPPEAAPVAVPAPAAPVVETPVAVVEPPPYDLIGVAIGGGTQIALLRHKATGEVLRLHPGEDAEGWSVTAIGGREMTLARDGRTETLALTATAATAGTETAGEAPRRRSVDTIAATILALPPRAPRPDP